MPLNTLRLNHAASSHPNKRIVFIKPLRRPASEKADYETAETFLRAIAAQCLPIMKAHHLSVTTLAEHEPNREFIGRNFNNGEIIELVLRTHGGQWVSFNMVQMVMMHELAHNMHMNHGKNFWKTRNLFSGEMRDLWDKGYTGEGFWGSGRVLGDLNDVMGNNTIPSLELEGLSICGGTFRSRRRLKRKRGFGAEGRELTWKEKKDKRIEKKFGKNGQRIGEDENKRMLLEIGKTGPIGGKPRVAQSRRGRELRAAAALARFGTNKKEVEDLRKEVAEDVDSTSGEEHEDEEDLGVNGEEAIDSNGSRLLDSHGFGMIKVCGGEDAEDVYVKQEMDELAHLHLNRFPTAAEMSQHQPGQPCQIKTEKTLIARVEPQQSALKKTQVLLKKPDIYIRRLSKVDVCEVAKAKPGDVSVVPPENESNQAPTEDSNISCAICSLSNDRFNATCLACAHVLDVNKVPNTWKCQSDACKDGSSQYVNGGDCGVCGICGTRRPLK